MNNPQDQIRLVMRQGPRPNEVFHLYKSVTSVGRASDNDIVVDDEQVSLYHACMTKENETWMLEDLDSRYGVWVNGQRLSGPTRLKPGHQVALAPTIVFEVEGDIFGEIDNDRGQEIPTYLWIAIGVLAVILILLLGFAAYMLLNDLYIVL